MFINQPLLSQRILNELGMYAGAASPLDGSQQFVNRLHDLVPDGNVGDHAVGASAASGRARTTVGVQQLAVHPAALG